MKRDIKREKNPVIFTRSYYSFFKSSLSVKKIVKIYKENNSNFASICDYNNFYGLWKFLELTKKNNLKAVVGVQITEPAKEGGFLLYLKNWEARKSVFKFLSKRNFNGKIPYEELNNLELDNIFVIALNYKEYFKLKNILKIDKFNLYLGIFKWTFYNLYTSYSFANKWIEKLKLLKIDQTRFLFLSRLFYQTNEDIEFIKILNGINGNYSLLNKTISRDSRIKEKGYLNNQAIYYARYHGNFFSFLKENKCEYINHIDEDITSKDIIYNNSVNKSIDGLKYNGCNSIFYDKINKLLKISLANTYKLIDTINLNWNKNKFYFPVFNKKKNDDDGQLKDIILKNLPRFYKKEDIEKAKIRFFYEFEIIKKKRFSSYFLFVHNILQYAIRNNIPYIGRGSAASSIISYILGISEVDPVKYNLYFERFINPERKSPPDIDIDFSWKERDKILKYLYLKYNKSKNNGKNRYLKIHDSKKNYVAMISTHFHFGYRRAIREVAKFYGLPDEFISIITKNIPHRFIGGNLGDLFNGQRKDILKNIDNILLAKIVKYSEKLKGFPFAIGVHPGGFCISDFYYNSSNMAFSINNNNINKNNSKNRKYSEITDYSPLEFAPKGIKVTQFDMYSIENTGLIKIDILSQRALGVLDDVLKNLKIELDNINKLNTKYRFINWILRLYESNRSFDKTPIFFDSRMWKMISQGDTIGCFYIESPGMRGLLKSLSCDNFELLIAASSVIRPGVSESGMKQQFIYYHNNPEKIKYIIPELKKILPDTYGIMIFQEDVIKVATKIGGLTLAQADILRRGMSGKTRSKKQINKLKNIFFKNALDKGINKKKISILWNQIESFAGYSFCKAHSASYAMLSIKLAYLKKYFPSYFYAAVINNYGGYYPVYTYIYEALSKGIIIKKPDILFSTEYTLSVNDSIYIGLDYYPFLNKNEIKKICSHFPYKTITDFILYAELTEYKIINLWHLNFFYPLYKNNGLTYLILKEIFRIIQHYYSGLNSNYKMNKKNYKDKIKKNIKPNEKEDVKVKKTEKNNAKICLYKKLLDIEQKIVSEFFYKNVAKMVSKEYYNILYYEYKYLYGFLSSLPVEIIFKYIKDYESGYFDNQDLLDFKEIERTYKHLKNIIVKEDIVFNFSKNFEKYVKKRINVIGFYITGREAITKQKKTMGFATFLDRNGLFEATFFPNCYGKYFGQLKYFKYFVISGRVISTNGFYSIEVENLKPIFTNFFYILKNIRRKNSVDKNKIVFYE